MISSTPYLKTDRNGSLHGCGSRESSRLLDVRTAGAFQPMRLFLYVMAFLMTIRGITSNTMLLIFPMWIVAELNRDRLHRLVRNVPLSVAFVGSGLFFGLLTEVFAVLNNLHLPPEKRILISPDPVLDLTYGIVYYAMLVGTWYVLVRGFTYSRPEVFVLSGIYGIMTEEGGQVFLRIFQTPIVGLLYALVVSFVYGIFPMLACMVSEEKLAYRRRSNLFVRLAVAPLALFLEWAVYGLLVLPTMKRVFEGG